MQDKKYLVKDNYHSNSKMKGALTTRKIVYMVLGGIGVGFVSGLFGGGGGIIIVPLLAIIGGLQEKEAHATSIAIVLPIAIVCMVVYLLSGTRANPMYGIYLTLGSLAGGLIGTFLLRKLSSNTLRLVFYMVMVVSGIRMII